MFENFPLKALLTLPACFLAFSQDNINIIHGIVYMTIIDTILGVLAGFKHRKLCSNKMARFSVKARNYGFAMASVWVLVAVEPFFSWTFRAVGIFIIITELFSVFENLSLLGFKIPVKIISKINKDFDLTTKKKRG
jgi:toxin secretion/phage lysis holin